MHHSIVINCWLSPLPSFLSQHLQMNSSKLANVFSVTSLVALLTSLLQERTIERIMIKIIILTNITTIFSINLQWTVNIQMTSFATFSTFKSLVFFLSGVKDHWSDELLLVTSFVKELIIRFVYLLLFHRLGKLIELTMLAQNFFSHIILRLC